MSDREPRRRKKKTEIQSNKRVTHAEDVNFMTSQPCSKDLDQQTEIEHSVSNHQPTFCAKLTFFMIFSTAAISFSLLFILLNGKGDVFPYFKSFLYYEELPTTGSDETTDNNVATFFEAEHLENQVSYNKPIEKTILKVFSEQVTEVLEQLHEDFKEQPEILKQSVEVIEQSNKALEDQNTTEEIYSEIDHEDEFDGGTLVPEDFVLTKSNIPVLDNVEYQTSIPTKIETQELDFNYNQEHNDIDMIEESLQFENTSVTNMPHSDFAIEDKLKNINDVLKENPQKALKMCEDMLHAYKNSPHLQYTKAVALDRLAELQMSNKLLEDSITAYKKTMSLELVPEELYLISGKRAADRMRFRGFMGRSLKLLLQMSEKFPEKIDLKNLVAVGFLLIGQSKEAKKRFLEVLKHDPNSGFAKVHLGFILKTEESKYEESIQLMSDGLSSKEHGVIDGRFYFHLGDALQRLGRHEEALKVYEDAVSEGLFLSTFQRSLYNVKGLTGKPWWNPEKTMYAYYFKILENSWLVIRDEALAITNDKISGFLPDLEGLQEKGDWKQFELYSRGRKIEKNCAKVPKTCKIISQMPESANCKRGQVKFSIMHPSTHIWAHTGPTNCRLRSHLGLVIPNNVSIRVANEQRNWEEGKVLLFDDSFEHEVWHNGSSIRLILIADFWHPELTTHQKRNLTPI